MSILTQEDDTLCKIVFAYIIASEILVLMHRYQFEKSRFGFSLKHPIHLHRYQDLGLREKLKI